MSRPRLLLVGNGMVGERLLEELDERGGLEALDVTVVGDEPHGAYSRIMLSTVLGGAHPDAIISKPRPWYAERGVTLLTRRCVDRLDCARRVALLHDRSELSYDTAVLAVGAEPIVLPLPGLTTSDGRLPDGVHVFRTMEDCLALRAEVDPEEGPRRVMVVGGGLLGLELAKALADQGHGVTLVHPFETLLNTQLDTIGGGLLRAQVEALGIEVVVGMTTAVRGDPVEALELEDGRSIPVDTLVLAVGARPRVDLAMRSGLAVRRGVVVDDRLRTSDPDVHAIGDCAEHDGVNSGLVAPGWDQARVLADLLTGADSRARYRGSTSYARLKVAGVEVASVGMLEPERDEDDVVQIIQERRGVYRKLVIREGRLAGGIAVGDPDAGPLLVGLHDRAEPLPANPIDIFCSLEAHAGRALGVEREVCNCNRVTEGAIRAAIEGGCASVGDLKRATRAGTGCGSCVPTLATLIERHAPEAAGSAPVRPRQPVVA
jgi:nitrite reductase (NADH) large subunit